MSRTLRRKVFKLANISQWKRISNKKIRHVDIDDTGTIENKSFRKIISSYDICDWNWNVEAKTKGVHIGRKKAAELNLEQEFIEKKNIDKKRILKALRTEEKSL